MAQIDNLFAAYTPADAAEQRFKARMLALLADEPRAFWRDVFSPGHFTCSALVTNRRRDKVLLMKHKYIGRWMQFGGHADGLSDLSKVALREASEESGFPEDRFTPSGGVSTSIFVPSRPTPRKASRRMSISTSATCWSSTTPSRCRPTRKG